MSEFSKEINKFHSLVVKQLDLNFGLDDNEIPQLKQGVLLALESCEYCFSRINLKYYKDKEGNPIINIYNSSQYAIFLYYLSNLMFRKSLCSSLLLDKIFYLNKMLNSIDLYYEVKLPKVFHVGHTLGSVIGRAKIGNNFSFNQNCTVGGNNDIYPILSDNVLMNAGSTIIGKCHVGSFVIFAANSFIKDTDVPNDTIVVGMYPNHKFLPLSSDYRNIYFGIFEQ
jgi:serine O-acetyltransferase